MSRDPEYFYIKESHLPVLSRIRGSRMGMLVFLVVAETDSGQHPAEIPIETFEATATLQGLPRRQIKALLRKAEKLGYLFCDGGSTYRLNLEFFDRKAEEITRAWNEERAQAGGGQL